MCVGGCTYMCVPVHVKVDIVNLPQLLSTFSTEAGSSVEPGLTDTAILL